MLDFVRRYGKNVFSQNGEDGIIQECLKRINLQPITAIEVGAPNKTYCSNINNLIASRIWYDINPEPESGVIKKEITPENVNDLPACDVLSIDIDGNDYLVWKAYKGKPAIVIIEINSSLNPEVDLFLPEQGASFYTMNKLANDKGYFLLCHTGNCVYVDLKYKDLFPEIHLIVTIERFFNRSWLPEEYMSGTFSLSDANGIYYKQ